MKKFLAFTLGEILIALGVIGVVSSLVLPQLINGQKAGTARAQFDTAYSILAKTLADMDADNVPVMPANYTSAGSLYNTIKNYMRISTDCGRWGASPNYSVCVASTYSGSENNDSYRIYNKKSNNKIDIRRLDDGNFVLTNGMLVAIENPGLTTRNIDGKQYLDPLMITIDINGKSKKPNRWGWDLFTFEVTNQGLLPLGAEGTHPTFSKNPATYCSKNSTNSENGITCAYYAAMDRDYFKELYQGH